MSAHPARRGLRGGVFGPYLVHPHARARRDAGAYLERAGAGDARRQGALHRGRGHQLRDGRARRARLLGYGASAPLRRSPGSTARPRTRRGLPACGVRCFGLSRRAAAIAAEAPTAPPTRNERVPTASVVVHGTIVGMIVWPSATSSSTSSCDSTRRSTSAPTRRRDAHGAGGQAANVAAWTTELGGLGAPRREARDRRGRRASSRGARPTASRWPAPPSRATTARSSRSSSPSGEPVDGLGPWRRAAAPARMSSRCAWLGGGGLRLHVTGYALFRSPIDEAAAKAAGAARRGGPDQRRPLVVELDPRFRPESSACGSRLLAPSTSSATRTKSGGSAARSPRRSGC